MIEALYALIFYVAVVVALLLSFVVTMGLVVLMIKAKRYISTATKRDVVI